ncbi:hypothetical protein NUN60_004357 [Escherichia coli]|nr:hypothetical protein [Escherichia coli]EJO8767412.1 hypothetical protein [Escherichia coli]
MQQISFLPGEMTPGERSLIQRALKTLDRHLHECNQVNHLIPTRVLVKGGEITCKMLK